MHRDKSQQPMRRPAAQRNIEARPKDERRCQRQEHSHGLNVETGEELPTDKMSEAGGHAAGGTRDAGSQFELASLQVQSGVRSNPGGAGCEPGGDDQDGEAGGGDTECDQPAHHSQLGRARGADDRDGYCLIHEGLL